MACSVYVWGWLQWLVVVVSSSSSSSSCFHSIHCWGVRACCIILAMVENNAAKSLLKIGYLTPHFLAPPSFQADRHLQPWLVPALAQLVPHMHTRLTSAWGSLQAPAGGCKLDEF